MPTLWNSEVNKAILEQKEVLGLWLYASIFQETRTMYIELVSETVYHINFTWKFIWNHLYLFIICIIYLESSTKVFSRIWTSFWTTGSSVKPSIPGWTLSENNLWVPGIRSCSLTYWFSFFWVNGTFEVTFSCIFVWNVSIALIFSTSSFFTPSFYWAI